MGQARGASGMPVPVRVTAIASLTPLEELDEDPSWSTPAVSTRCVPAGPPTTAM